MTPSSVAGSRRLYTSSSGCTTIFGPAPHMLRQLAVRSETHGVAHAVFASLTASCRRLCKMSARRPRLQNSPLHSTIRCAGKLGLVIGNSRQLDLHPLAHICFKFAFAIPLQFPIAAVHRVQPHVT